MRDRSVFCASLTLPKTQGGSSPKKSEVKPRDSALLHPLPRRRRRFLAQEPCADELTKPSVRLISMRDRTVFCAPLPLPGTLGGSSPKKSEVTPRNSALLGTYIRSRGGGDGSRRCIGLQFGTYMTFHKLHVI